MGTLFLVQGMEEDFPRGSSVEAETEGQREEEEATKSVLGIFACANPQR
jgi:hypothetical protein